MVKQAKKFTAPQVTAGADQRSNSQSPANARYGLQSITDLLPRVIDQYDFEPAGSGGNNSPKRKRVSAHLPPRKPRVAIEQTQRPSNPAAATITLTTSPIEQATFGWE